MEFDTLFQIAMQSSFILGLIHGINPCGHSWLVLAPFVVGKKDGKQVSYLTAAFLLGTAVACITIGASLGAVSKLIPENLQIWVEIGTATILILIGLILIIRPTLLHNHNHDHDHDHDHSDDHHGHHSCCHHEKKGCSEGQKITGIALFGVGFVNMIIPCPTVAIMYGYAIDSGNVLKATLVFAIYAMTTAITVSVVIYAIFRVTTLLKSLKQHWIENATMRTAGVLTVVFSAGSLYQMT